jgi:hypothetical protein
MLAGIVLCAGTARAGDLRSSAQTLGPAQHNLTVLNVTVAAPSVTVLHGPITAHPVTGNVSAPPSITKRCRPHPDPRHGVQWICYQ